MDKIAKEVFLLSYQTKLTRAIAQRGITNLNEIDPLVRQNIKAQVAKDMRPQVKEDLASGHRENSGLSDYFVQKLHFENGKLVFYGGAYDGTEFTALSRNAREGQSPYYSPNDEITDTLVEKQIKAGATKVITCYHCPGKSARDVVVFEKNPDSETWTMTVINSAPDGTFFTFEETKARIETNFSSLAKVEPMKNVFLLSDIPIDKNAVVEDVQRVIAETQHVFLQGPAPKQVPITTEKSQGEYTAPKNQIENSRKVIVQSRNTARESRRGTAPISLSTAKPETKVGSELEKIVLSRIEQNHQATKQNPRPMISSLGHRLEEVGKRSTLVNLIGRQLSVKESTKRSVAMPDLSKSPSRHSRDKSEQIKTVQRSESFGLRIFLVPSPKPELSYGKKVLRRKTDTPILTARIPAREKSRQKNTPLRSVMTGQIHRKLTGDFSKSFKIDRVAPKFPQVPSSVKEYLRRFQPFLKKIRISVQDLGSSEKLGRLHHIKSEKKTSEKRPIRQSRVKILDKIPIFPLRQKDSPVRRKRRILRVERFVKKKDNSSSYKLVNEKRQSLPSPGSLIEKWRNTSARALKQPNHRLSAEKIVDQLSKKKVPKLKTRTEPVPMIPNFTVDVRSDYEFFPMLFLTNQPALVLGVLLYLSLVREKKVVPGFGGQHYQNNLRRGRISVRPFTHLALPTI